MKQFCFIRFSMCFPVISGFSTDTHIRIHYHFSLFSFSDSLSFLTFFLG